MRCTWRSCASVQLASRLLQKLMQLGAPAAVCASAAALCLCLSGGGQQLALRVQDAAELLLAAHKVHQQLRVRLSEGVV
jgi:hypothetical protein